MHADIGLVGLGTMGAALALNIAEKGYRIAVHNRTAGVVQRFAAEAGELGAGIVPSETLADLVAAIKPPRAVLLLVPAGAPVDAMIAGLRPLMEPADIIVDAGNANFRDTRRRAAEAELLGARYLGVGVSGGEDGARHGPSIMGGGPREAWNRIEPVMRAIAARHEGEPCAAWLGTDGAGHFVKTIHNGIEYADMQMIAEIYGILRDGFGWSAPEIAPVFEWWNEGPLRSYLVEITAEVLRTVDPESGNALVDVIVDSAGQKGTGRWSAIEALHLAAPASAIEAAVAARTLSSRHEEREAGALQFGGAKAVAAEPDLGALEAALLAGKIACYAQGFGILALASAEFGWNLPLGQVPRIWRAGCIIRSAMLDEMTAALEAAPEVNLMFAPGFAAHMAASHGHLRAVVAQAALAGVPVPALGAALAYFDTMRSARTTANLIQGQRDFFGAHGFARLDRQGMHHGPWSATSPPDPHRSASA